MISNIKVIVAAATIAAMAVLGGVGESAGAGYNWTETSLFRFYYWENTSSEKLAKALVQQANWKFSADAWDACCKVIGSQPSLQTLFKTDGGRIPVSLDARIQYGNQIWSTSKSYLGNVVSIWLSGSADLSQATLARYGTALCKETARLFFHNATQLRQNSLYSDCTPSTEFMKNFVRFRDALANYSALSYYNWGPKLSYTNVKWGLQYYYSEHPKWSMVWNEAGIEGRTFASHALGYFLVKQYGLEKSTNLVKNLYTYRMLSDKFMGKVYGTGANGWLPFHAALFTVYNLNYEQSGWNAFQSGTLLSSAFKAYYPFMSKL